MTFTVKIKKKIGFTFFVIFSLISVQSNEIINFWVALEGQSLSILMLLSINKEKNGRLYIYFLIFTLIGAISLVCMLGLKRNYEVVFFVTLLQFLWFIKLGLFPGHLISLSIMEGMN